MTGDPIHDAMIKAIQQIADQYMIRIEEVRVSWIDKSTAIHSDFLVADIYLGSRS